MSSFKIFDIAGSGMSAQSVRLNMVASNLANADSVSGDPNNVYRAKHPVFQAAMGSPGDLSTAKVNVTGIAQSQAAPATRYEPGNPLADAPGECLCTERQRGRGNGGHDLGLALLPEQRRGVEHLARHVARDAEAGTVAPQHSY